MSYIQIVGGTAGGTGGGIAASLLGNNTSGALALVSTGTLRLAGGNNITLSQNGQSITISGAANAGGGTMSMFEPIQFYGGFSPIATVSVSQSSAVFYPLYIPANLSCSQMANLYSFSISTSSNSSFAAVFSHSAGIYTLTGSTLNLITGSSGATNFQFTNTSNNSTASLQSIRSWIMPMNFNASPGNYWIGHLWASSSTNANWATFFPVFGSISNITLLGLLGTASNVSTAQAWVKGVGVYSVQTAGLPASVNISGDLVSGSSAAPQRQLYMQFQGF